MWKVRAVSQHSPSSLRWKMTHKMKLKLPDSFPPSWGIGTMTPCNSFRVALLERATFQDTLQLCGLWAKTHHWFFYFFIFVTKCHCNAVAWYRAGQKSPSRQFSGMTWYVVNSKSGLGGNNLFQCWSLRTSESIKCLLLIMLPGLQTNHLVL